VNCLKLVKAQGRAIKFSVSLQLRMATVARSKAFDKRMKSASDYCSSALIFLTYCGTVSFIRSTTVLRHAAMLRDGGAMNSGPTGSVMVSLRIRLISALAEASSAQPVTSSTGRS
jgi:hypothetical protein